MPRAYYGEPAIQDYFNQLVQRKVDAEVRTKHSGTAQLRSGMVSLRRGMAWHCGKLRCAALASPQVGLLVGKEAVGSRDLILSTVSTPTQVRS